MSGIPPQPPLAQTVSVEAREALAPMLAASMNPPKAYNYTVMRLMGEALLRPIGKARGKRYGVSVMPGSMGGVPVQFVQKGKAVATPADGPLLINYHGGGFQFDSGSLTETIPIAGLTGLPVAAVLYRLAPEHPYPAAVDDALAVYRDALRTRSPHEVAIFGTSAGAYLSTQLIARLKKDNLPMPAAVGFYSGSADCAMPGDVEGYFPPLLAGKTLPEVIAPYIGAADPRDPMLSPLNGDLSAWPPMQLMSSTRDILLSQTVRLHLALRKAGSPADLIVFEGMPHAFWAYLECPETDEAFAAQAAFLKHALTGKS
jgi:acetyl esterase/lipase